MNFPPQGWQIELTKYSLTGEMAYQFYEYLGA